MNRIDQSRGYKTFSIFNTAFLILLAAICIIPFIHMIAVSFSDQASSNANAVGLLPVGGNLNAYRKIFSVKYLFGSFLVTMKRMFLGTVISMLLSISVAYPLSFDSKHFPGRSIYVGFFFFSMLFGGGIIPYYILIDNLGLMDSIWALVLGAVPMFFVIVLLNYFRQLPSCLHESAQIDGASHFRIMFKIYLPLSLPSIATLSLMSLVGHWNEWFSGMIFMKSVKNYPLQTYIYNAMQNISEFIKLGQVQDQFTASRQSTIAALTIFSIIPVLFAFPLLNKYIKTGLVLGSVIE